MILIISKMSFVVIYETYISTRPEVRNTRWESISLAMSQLA